MFCVCTFVECIAAQHLFLAAFTIWLPADFIKYYADVETSLPVRWTFLWSGAQFHVLQFNTGETLSKKLWQAPSYCFNNPNSSSPIFVNEFANGRMLRLQAAQQVEAEVQLLQQQQAQQQNHQQQQQQLEEVQMS